MLSIVGRNPPTTGVMARILCLNANDSHGISLAHVALDDEKRCNVGGSDGGRSRDTWIYGTLAVPECNSVVAGAGTLADERGRKPLHRRTPVPLGADTGLAATIFGLIATAIRTPNGIAILVRTRIGSVGVLGTLQLVRSVIGIGDRTDRHCGRLSAHGRHAYWPHSALFWLPPGTTS